MSENKVSIIGLGLAGMAIAEHLLEQDYAVSGYDINPERNQLLEKAGGQAAASPADAADQSTVVILSLLNSDIVREVIEGPDGILAAEPRPSIIIDTTTGDPAATESTARLCGEKGIAYLDATLSGSSEKIREGRATVLVGAETPDFDSNAAILKAIGTEVFHMGDPGSGARAKLAVNLILGLNRMVLAEGLVFAEALGLDSEAFLDILPATSAQSRAAEVKGIRMIQQDFEPPAARLAQHRKDVGLMLKAAADAEIELPLSGLHAEVLDAAIAGGEGDLDNAAVILEMRRRIAGG